VAKSIQADTIEVSSAENNKNESCAQAPQRVLYIEQQISDNKIIAEKNKLKEFQSWLSGNHLKNMKQQIIQLELAPSSQPRIKSF